MIAELLAITPQSLGRWLERQQRPEPCPRSGRPVAIGDAVRRQIRSCYRAHHGQWGPQVLACWCRREGLGDWSSATVAAVVADLAKPEPPQPAPVRYEVTASNVMWSEDGTGFGLRGRKQELLVVQDEHARLKLNWDLVPGPAKSPDVVRYLEAAFEQYGAPLVLKHDGDGIFHTPEVAALLERYGVLDLTSPAHYPGYNGKQERSMRDIKSYVRALRRDGDRSSLGNQIGLAMADLNEERPRPVLEGRTAQEAYNEGQKPLPSREDLCEAVNREQAILRQTARSRMEKKSARRRAMEMVLLRYGLMEIEGKVSHDFLAGGWTK
jgi:hypothetical protein